MLDMPERRWANTAASDQLGHVRQYANSEVDRGPAVGLRKRLAGTCNLDSDRLKHDSVATLSRTQGEARVTQRSTTQRGDSGVGGSRPPS